MISIKRNHQQSNFGFIFASGGFLFPIESEQFYFWKSHFFTLFQSNYFDTTVTFSEQLFLKSSCFFEGILFQNNHFFRSSYFPEQLFFQSETSTEQSLFENTKLFRAVTFPNSYFDEEIVCIIKISSEEIPFTISQLPFLSTASLPIYQLLIK